MREKKQSPQRMLRKQDSYMGKAEVDLPVVTYASDSKQSQDLNVSGMAVALRKKMGDLPFFTNKISSKRNETSSTLETFARERALSRSKRRGHRYGF